MGSGNWSEFYIVRGAEELPLATLCPLPAPSAPNGPTSEAHVEQLGWAWGRSVARTTGCMGLFDILFSLSTIKPPADDQIIRKQVRELLSK